ncbi:MAG: DUF4388 domain-containing protein [Thermodesulfobacteriota bacterium]
MQLAGNIEDLGLGEIMQILGFSNKSGVLCLRRGEKEAVVTFKEGKVVKAVSTSIKEGVGELLLKEGTITREQFDQAREKQAGDGYGETLGAVLEGGFNVPVDRLDAIATKQIEKVVYSLFLWPDGNFIFELGGESDTPETIKTDTLQYTLQHGINPQFIAMEGARLADEAGREGAGEAAVSVPEGREAPTEAEAESEVENAFFQPEAPTEAPLGGEALAEEGTEDPFFQQKTTAEAHAGGEAASAESEVEKEKTFPPETTAEKPEGVGEAKSFIKSLIEEIGFEEFSAEPEGAVEKVAESKGLRVLKGMLEELANAFSLNEVVLLILRFSGEIMSRSVVFAVKKGNIVGLGQSGVDIEGDSADKRVRKMKLSLAESSILRDAIDSKAIVVKALEGTPGNEYIVEQLGGQRPLEAFAAPVLVQGKVAVIIYGDNLPEQSRLDDLSALDIFLGQTSQSLERILMKRDSGGDGRLAAS